jgi:hypothetical protein
MLTPSEMKDRSLRLAREGDFIECIYNYCDRCCEHCSFTSHCLSFETNRWLETYKPDKNLPDDPTLLLSEKNAHYSQAVEAIYWYNFFVSAKIYRALIPDDILDPEEIQTDSNGSAKITLRALDRLSSFFHLSPYPAP